VSVKYSEFQKLLRILKEDFEEQHKDYMAYVNESGLLENIQAFDVPILEELAQIEGLLRVIDSAEELLAEEIRLRTVIVTYLNDDGTPMDPQPEPYRTISV
jgi:hypothetical protein